MVSKVKKPETMRERILRAKEEQHSMPYASNIAEHPILPASAPKHIHQLSHPLFVAGDDVCQTTPCRVGIRLREPDIQGFRV